MIWSRLRSCLLEVELVRGQIWKVSQFPQTHKSLWKLDSMEWSVSVIWRNTFYKKIHFSIWTNIFKIFYRYILQFLQYIWQLNLIWSLSDQEMDIENVLKFRNGVLIIIWDVICLSCNLERNLSWLNWDMKWQFSVLSHMYPSTYKSWYNFRLGQKISLIYWSDL